MSVRRNTTIQLNIQGRSAYSHLVMLMCKADYFFTRYNGQINPANINRLIEKATIDRNVTHVNFLLEHLEQLDPQPSHFKCLMHIALIMTKRRLEEWAYLLDNPGIDRQTYVQPFTQEDQTQLIHYQNLYHTITGGHYASVLKRDYLALRQNPGGIDHSNMFHRWIVPEVDILVTLNIVGERQIFADIPRHMRTLRQLFPESLEEETQQGVRNDMYYIPPGQMEAAGEIQRARQRARLENMDLPPPSHPFWEDVRRVPKNKREDLEARRSNSMQEVWDCGICGDEHPPGFPRIKCEICKKSSCLDGMQKWDQDLFNAGKDLICPFCRGVHRRKVEPRFQSS